MEIPVLFSKLERLQSLLRVQKSFLVAEIEHDLSFITFLERHRNNLIVREGKFLQIDTSFGDKSRQLSANRKSYIGMNDILASPRDTHGQKSKLPFKASGAAGEFESGSSKSLAQSRRVLSANRVRGEQLSANHSQTGLLRNNTKPNESFHSHKDRDFGNTSHDDRTRPNLGISSDLQEFLAERRANRTRPQSTQHSPGSVLNHFSTPKTGEDLINRKMNGFIAQSPSLNQTIPVEGYQRDTFGPTETLQGEPVLAVPPVSPEYRTPIATGRETTNSTSPAGRQILVEQRIVHSVVKTNSGPQPRMSSSSAAEKKGAVLSDSKQTNWKSKLGTSVGKPSNETTAPMAPTRSKAQMNMARQPQPMQTQQLRQTMSVENNLSRLTQFSSKNITKPSMTPSNTVAGQVKSGMRQLLSLVPDRPDNSPTSPSWQNKLAGDASSTNHNTTMTGGLTNIYVKRLKINMNEISNKPPTQTELQDISGQSGGLQRLAKAGPQPQQDKSSHQPAQETLGSQHVGSGIAKFKTALIDVLGGSMRKASMSKV